MTRIRWSHADRADLREIYAHIARDSRVYARRFVERIKSAIENVRLIPEAGAKVVEWDRDDIREIYVGNDRLIYRIRDVIEVVAVIHGARQLPGPRRPAFPGGREC